jgi:DNA-binding beta-propeller fold protein YncE
MKRVCEMKKAAFLATLAVTVAAWGLAVQAQAQGRAEDPRMGRTGQTPNLQTPPAPELPYAYVPGPQPPYGQKFGAIGSVALMPNGNLIVFNRNPIIEMVEYTSDLKFVRAFNPGLAGHPHGLRTDRHGDMWVIDSFLNVVWKLNAKGEPLMMLGRRGEVGAWTDDKWNGMFNQPLDVAIDDDDNLYVVQGHAGTSPPPACSYCATYVNSSPSVSPGSDPRIMKFDKTGKFLGTTALSHGPTERYPFIHSVVITPKGEVWVTDRQADRIIVLDRDLKRLREIQEPMLTSGLFVDAKGAIWLSGGMDGMIAKLDGDGKIVGWFGKAGHSPDPTSTLIGEAHYLVVTPDQKTIYIADSQNAKVLVAQRK